MGLPVQPNGASIAKYYPTKPDVLPEVDSGIINNSSNTQRLAIKKGLDHGSRLGVLGRTLSIYSRNTHLQMMHHQLCGFRRTDMYIAHSQPSPVRVIAALVCIPLSCPVWLRLDPTDAHQHHTSQKHHLESDRLRHPDILDADYFSRGYHHLEASLQRSLALALCSAGLPPVPCSAPWPRV